MKWSIIDFAAIAIVSIGAVWLYNTAVTTANLPSYFKA